MIDANALLVNWIADEITTRVCATVAPEYLPETQQGFDPQAGPWVVVSRRGGNAHPEKAWIAHSMQVRVWAGPGQYDVAGAMYGAVYDLLHGATSVDRSPDGFVILCQEESHGQDLVDTDTGYANVNSFFELRCQDT